MNYGKLRDLGGTRMSWCTPIISWGFDCFEFGIVIGIIFTLLFLTLYKPLIFNRFFNKQDAQDNKDNDKIKVPTEVKFKKKDGSIVTLKAKRIITKKYVEDNNEVKK